MADDRSKRPRKPVDPGAQTLVGRGSDDAPATEPDAGGERYEERLRLGEGGMGEVVRVYDRALDRDVARKTLSERAGTKPLNVRRFLDEARMTARLEHPGIVPVHDLGTLPDGRPWFTMREVRGTTLLDRIEAVHRAPGGLAEAEVDGWSLRRLVEALRAVCDVVAYAHSRGVVHRDLKPENVMIGPYGEVQVVDWGLARAVGRADGAARSTAGLDAIDTRRMLDQFKGKQVAGTPSYMAPEQARGEVERIRAHTDVYALGGMLHAILHGAPPYVGSSAEAVWRQVLAGPPEPVVTLGAPPELVACASRAMAREPSDRTAGARQLAQELVAWLDGWNARAEAERLLARAADLAMEIGRVRKAGERFRGEATSLSAGLQPWSPEDHKAAGWAAADEATRMDDHAALLDTERTEQLYAALSHAPGLVDAHAALATRFLEEHAAAERARDAGRAERAELRLAGQVQALPAEHPVRARATVWLKGDGAVSLVTDPPGAEVEAWRVSIVRRRSVARLERSLGRTPLVEVALGRGSWLLVARAPGHTPVRYPVFVERGEHWDGVPPEGGSPVPIALPLVRDLGPDDVWVPPGWFSANVGANGVPFDRKWCDGFVMKRFPVVHAEYLAFLDALVVAGAADEALRLQPRSALNLDHDEGEALYARTSEGRFTLRTEGGGSDWRLDWPVVFVHAGCAARFAAWRAASERLPWRLPGEFEWEKAARGTDGRAYPWGDHYDPSRCLDRYAFEGGSPRMGPVGTFPLDESPYGIRDLAGNVSDWCADDEDFSRGAVRVVPPDLALVEVAAERDGDRRHASRGGHWATTGAACAAWGRWSAPVWSRTSARGFRLVRSWPSPTQG